LIKKGNQRLVLIVKNKKMDEILTLEEFAKIMKVSKITIYRMIKSGQIPAVKFGKSWRINQTIIKDLFNKDGNRN
jgi:excisionase family DNA binding protein